MTTNHTDRIQSSRDLFIGAVNAAANEIYYQHDNEYHLLAKIVMHLGTDANGFVGFSLDNPLHVAYSPDGVDKYDYNRRRNTKLGRYIQRNISEEERKNVSDALLDKFVCAVMKHNVDDECFSLVSGNSIIAKYRAEWGDSSCMTYSDSPVEMYSENDCCQMLCYRNGDIQGRAILWTLRNGKRVLDRIYPADSHVVAAMRDYAVKNDIVYRVSTSLPKGTVELSDGGKYEIEVSCSTGRWPYMDTFRYASGDEYHCVLSNDPYRYHDAVLDDTDGSFGEVNHESCYHCEEMIDVDNDSYERIDDVCVCESCVASHYTFSHIMEEWIRDEDVERLVDVDCDDEVSSYYARRNCLQCPECEQYFAYSSSGQRVDPDDSNTWTCDDCMEEHYDTCDNCFTRHRKDEMTTVADGDDDDVELCHDCCEVCECGEALHPSREFCPACVDAMEEEQLATAYDKEEIDYHNAANADDETSNDDDDVCNCRDCRFAHTCQHSTLSGRERIASSPIYKVIHRLRDDVQRTFSFDG